MKRWVFGLAPLMLLAVLVILFVSSGPPGFLEAGFPPVEELAFERISLEPGQIVLHVINDGADPVTIAQVMVNGSWWSYSVEPRPTLKRLERGRIKLAYP